ncbi:MAG: NTP transferase domain-containing protein [Candidatus Latescibacteria bacterium]|nr:NTP transferase domain-containing protein [Candidatus Latescibacterota bacterium]
MVIDKVVLPVAGQGVRLLPTTKSLPKEMLPVGFKPVVQHVVEEMVEQGLDKFLFVTGRKKRAIEDHFDDDPELDGRSIDELDYAARNVRFYYVRQRRPSGNAAAVALAAEFVGDESFVVGFGDTILHSPHRQAVVSRMIDSHLEHGSAATIGVWEVSKEDISKYGVVQPAETPGDDFAIEDIVEKPQADQAPSSLAVAARYVFTPEIFAAIDALEPGLGGELWLTDAIRILLRQGKKVRCVRLRPDEWRYDIGSPLTYYRAFADFALMDPQYGDAFRRYMQEKLAE